MGDLRSFKVSRLNAAEEVVIPTIKLSFRISILFLDLLISFVFSRILYFSSFLLVDLLPTLVTLSVKFSNPKKRKISCYKILLLYKTVLRKKQFIKFTSQKMIQSVIFVGHYQNRSFIFPKALVTE